jgi:ABC-2 type transport system permease protein
MLWTIARTQLTVLWRGGGFRAAALLLTVGVLAGIVSGVSHYSRQQMLNRQAAEREHARWMSQPDRDPHSATHFGQTAYRELSLLSAFDSGVDPYAGIAVFLEAHKQNVPRFPWAADAARLPGTGHFTASTALRLLVPLFLILLAHGALSQERESGILALVSATGAPSATIVFGKFAGLALGAAAVVAPLVLIAAIPVALVSPVAPTGDWFLRVLGLAAAYAAYSFVFLALALAVSGLARSTSASRILLFGFWAVTVLIAPRAVADLSQWVYPPPSALEVETGMANDPDRITGAKRYEAFKSSVLAKYGVKTVAELPVNFSGLTNQYAEERTNRLIDIHFGKLAQAQKNGARWIAMASWVSPAVALDGASMALAGSDLAHYNRFVELAEAHRRLVVGKLTEFQINHPVKAGTTRAKAGREVWASIPTFRHTIPGADWAVRESATSFAALVLWAVFGAAALLFTAHRRILN